MAMGKADLKAKVCVLPAKYCLILLSIAHVFVFLVVIGVVVYVYCTTTNIREGFLFFLLPGFLALISGLGALMFLWVRQKLVLLISIAWPILVGLIATFVYGMIIAVWSTKGTTVTSSDGREKTEFTIPIIVAISIGMLLIPLSCCCCVILACMGFNKSDDGGAAQMKKPGEGQENKGNMEQGPQGQANGNGNGGGAGPQGNGNGNQNPIPNQNQNQNQVQNQNHNPIQNNGVANYGGGRKKDPDHSGHLY